jgi:hypothetical protein
MTTAAALLLQVATFSSNPKFGLDITDDTADVFVSLAVPDARLTHGCDHWNTPLQQTPLSIDIVAEDQLMHPYDTRHVIASSDIKQASHNLLYLMRVLSSSSMLCINCIRSVSSSLRVDRKITC